MAFMWAGVLPACLALQYFAFFPYFSYFRLYCVFRLIHLSVKGFWQSWLLCRENHCGLPRAIHHCVIHKTSWAVARWNLQEGRCVCAKFQQYGFNCVAAYTVHSFIHARMQAATFIMKLCNLRLSSNNCLPHLNQVSAICQWREK